MTDRSGPRRRDALALLGVAPLAACGAPDEGDPAAIAPSKRLTEGEPVDFVYPAGHAAFIVKLGRPALGGVGPDGDIVAFHRACPHMGCPIQAVDAARGTLGPCPCHLSVFDLERGGVQVQGRATQNLVQVELEVLPDGTVCAVGLSGLAYGEPLREGDA